MSQVTENKKSNPQDKSKKVSTEKRRPKAKDSGELMTRVVVRHLPPSLLEAEFLEAVSPVPEYESFYYANSDSSLGDFSFSRAYFKFKKVEDMELFNQRFDGYIFVDSKGNEYPCIVELAPLQKLYRGRPNHPKSDPKENKIEEDTDFIQFQEMLQKMNEEGVSAPVVSFDTLLEEIENRNNKMNEPKTTPLLEFLHKRRLERFKLKEEKKKKKLEYKKKLEEQKKQNKQAKQNKEKPSVEMKKEQPTYVVKVRAKDDKQDDSKATTSKPAVNKHAHKPSQDTQKKNAESDKKVVRETNKDRPKGRAPVRNKDRPAIELYQAKVKQPAGPCNAEKPKSDKPAEQASTSAAKVTENKRASNSNSSSEPNTTNKSSQAAKFKQRVFTRTRPA